MEKTTFVNFESEKTEARQPDPQLLNNLVGVVKSTQSYINNSARADRKMLEASELRSKARAQEKKNQKYEKKVKFLSKTINFTTIFWGIIGFLIGAYIMIQYILESHGPTVTIKGTLEATIIYLLSGAFYALVLGGGLRGMLKSDIVWYEKRITEGKAKIADLNLKADTCVSMASIFDDLSIDAIKNCENL